MIAVIVPAHDEEAHVAQCLESILVAARHPGLRGEAVEVILALDSCSDGTGRIAASYPVRTLPVALRNVGAARAAGCRTAIECGARWLAHTDADSRVPPDWLHGQLQARSEAFCGMVRVECWDGYAPMVRQAFEARHPAREPHPHVHGANLGVSAEAYLRCGGWQSLARDEDVALVGSLDAIGARVARLVHPVVATSARRQARLSGGFADYLRALEQALLPPAASADATA